MANRDKLVEIMLRCPRALCDHCGDDNWLEANAQQFADHLLANGVVVQQQDGCDFCKTFNFAKAKTEVDKYGARIILIGGACYDTGEDVFKFCPECGRKLPEPQKEDTNA